MLSIYSYIIPVIIVEAYYLFIASIHYEQFLPVVFYIELLYMNKKKNPSPSQGLNLGLPNTSQMLLPLRHQDS